MIEAAITPETTAILPVHVYGNPCRILEIQKIADTHGLKVIYDACHTFGVKVNNIPVLNFGDLSVLSFHATKVFTTFEGGAIVCHDETMKEYIDNLKNFGFIGETRVIVPGINGKMNEMQAAIGLLQLKGIDTSIEKRKQIDEMYRKRLSGIEGIHFIKDLPGTNHCYSYFPVFIDEPGYGKTRDDLYNELKKHNIFVRRYFYPLISQFPSYKNLESAQPGKMPVAEKVSRAVICLPIYPDLQFQDVERVSELIASIKK